MSKNSLGWIDTSKVESLIIELDYLLRGIFIWWMLTTLLGYNILILEYPVKYLGLKEVK